MSDSTVPNNSDNPGSAGMPIFVEYDATFTISMFAGSGHCEIDFANETIYYWSSAVGHGLGKTTGPAKAYLIKPLERLQGTDAAFWIDNTPWGYGIKLSDAQGNLVGAAIPTQEVDFPVAQSDTTGEFYSEWKRPRSKLSA